MPLAGEAAMHPYCRMHSRPACCTHTDLHAEPLENSSSLRVFCTCIVQALCISDTDPRSCSWMAGRPRTHLLSLTLLAWPEHLLQGLRPADLPFFNVLLYLHHVMQCPSVVPVRLHML